MDYVDLDIICDGLFILSCLCELDVHRKVKKFRMIIEEYLSFYRKFLVPKVLKC